MVDDKFMLISLEDPRAKSIADVMGSKTCKKIIDYLASNEEASQKDLSDALDIPMNTMEYNMKKLLSSGIIQKRQNFFWSKKGKKIPMYELSRKSIVISPGRKVSDKMKSLLPAFMITGVLSFGAYVWERIQSVENAVGNGLSRASDAMYSSGMDYVMEEASSVAPKIVETASKSAQPLWMWFFLGGLIAILVLSIVNWRKL